MRRLLHLLLLVVASSAWLYGRDDPDKWSTGGVWPLPYRIQYGAANRTITADQVFIDLGDLRDCDVLQSMSDIYLRKWLFPFPVVSPTGGSRFVITVVVTSECPKGTPKSTDTEEYSLTVTTDGATLKSSTVWGALHGMETFSQLVYYDQKSAHYAVRTAQISDRPRFKVRGVMLDSSRHFLSINVLKRQLDIMAMNKMNLFHWHLVDSESFPYQSARFPELHTVGAYSPLHVYSRSDVADIIAYARLRGIRVVPEFDLPGHTLAWRGHEGLLADCYDPQMNPVLPNLVDPTNETNFDFISQFLEEVTETFPDEFIHLGGDEVSGYINQCWKRNPKIQKYMKDHNIATVNDLENYFFQRLFKIVAGFKNKRTPVFWQEVMVNSHPPMPNSIFHVWEGGTFEQMGERVASITKQGFQAIVSTCWYLNYIKYGADWKSSIAGNAQTNAQYYYCDPTNFTGTAEQKALVIGGMAALWGEFVDNTNIESRFWPRASAAAERLWSPAELTKDAEAAWPRLHELRCRLVARGYRIQPTNFPDYCPYEFVEPLPNNQNLRLNTKYSQQYLSIFTISIISLISILML